MSAGERRVSVYFLGRNISLIEDKTINIIFKEKEGDFFLKKPERAIRIDIHNSGAMGYYYIEEGSGEKVFFEINQLHQQIKELVTDMAQQDAELDVTAGIDFSGDIDSFFSN